MVEAALHDTEEQRRLAASCASTAAPITTFAERIRRSPGSYWEFHADIKRHRDYRRQTLPESRKADEIFRSEFGTERSRL
jgi:hypothetical protein